MLNINKGKGLFTVSVSVSVCSDANKWVQFTSIVVFTLNDAKHQRKETQTLTLMLTVNRPLGGHPSVFELDKSDRKKEDLNKC